jgi:hypothetical protein
MDGPVTGFGPVPGDNGRPVSGGNGRPVCKNNGHESNDLAVNYNGQGCHTYDPPKTMRGTSEIF